MVFEQAQQKAQSKAAEWFAESKRLEATLTGAKAKLKALQAGDAVMDKVADVPVVGDQTEYLQQKMDAFVADAEADVDRLEAELAVVKTKLKAAQKAKDTAESVSEAAENLGDKARDAKAKASDAVADAKDSAKDKLDD